METLIKSKSSNDWEWVSIQRYCWLCAPYKLLYIIIIITGIGGNDMPKVVPAHLYYTVWKRDRQATF